MRGACGAHGREKNAYRILVGRPVERNRLEGLYIDCSMLKWNV
jgi:hypothetical protein